MRWLGRLRNRVLGRARIRRGNTVLDLGAGTGLIALGARCRARTEGHVIALDISHPALVVAREASPTGQPDVARLTLVAGEATALPLADASVNVVTTRSVLIYVEDKAAAAREILRVLRPGGRVSMFEPINNAPSAYGLPEPGTERPANYSPRLFEEFARVLELMQASTRRTGGEAAEKALMHFDERDLTRIFIEAGFQCVALTYEVGYGKAWARGDMTPSRYDSQPNPNMLSYGDAAREELGDRASAHLDELAEADGNRERRGLNALAFLTAKRSRRRSGN